MDVRRRDLLKWGLLQTAWLSLPVRTRAGEVFANARRSTPSVLQGLTDHERTEFSVVARAGSGIEARVLGPDGVPRAPARAEDLSRPGHTHELRRFHFVGLSPGVDYRLQLVTAAGHLADEREFRTLAPRTGGPLKFAICSCMDDSRHEPAIWQDLVRQRPDLVFFIGDSVYCDDGSQTGTWITPDTMYRRFCEARTTLEIFYVKRLIPILATWDDHDFAQDNTGAWYPQVTEAQRNFQSFFAQSGATEGFRPGPGVAGRFDAAGQRFLLLDDRSERTRSGSGDRYGQWGRAQEEWLLDEVRTAPGPVWLMNGSQFFPQMMFKESVSADHPEQLAAVVDAVRERGAKVLFASGDVHYSELSELEPALLGYRSYEITSSAVHSFKLPGLPGIVKNPRRIASTGERNYVLVTGAPTDEGGLRARVESRSAGNRVNFTRVIEV